MFALAVYAKAGQLVLDLQVAIALVHELIFYSRIALFKRVHVGGASSSSWCAVQDMVAFLTSEAAVRNWFRLWVALPPLRLSTTHQIIELLYQTQPQTLAQC